MATTVFYYRSCLLFLCLVVLVLLLESASHLEGSGKADDQHERGQCDLLAQLISLVLIKDVLSIQL